MSARAKRGSRPRGFFADCTMRLDAITNYFNKNKKLPLNVISIYQWNWYKKNKNDDVTFDYFKNYNNNINISFNSIIHFNVISQYSNYSKFNFSLIIPFINKYFSPSTNIKNIKKTIENKYNINYDNICVLFYRGNDKNRETKICGYNEYITKANEIHKKNPNIKFLIQSDETEFIEEMLNKYPNNSFYFKDEIRHIKKCDDTVDIVMKDMNEEFSKKFLAITLIMSKCKYIVCGSGNCSQWIIFYRGNVVNVYQQLKNTWIIH